jgi:single-strand DNA-binding protein
MNLIILIGRLARDPEIRHSSTGMAIANITLAVDRQKSKDQEGPSADFLRATAFGKTAELIDQYVRKGNRLGIEGRIQNNNYEKDGKTVYQDSIIINKIEFLTSKNEQEGGGGFAQKASAGPLGSDLKDDGFDTPFVETKAEKKASPKAEKKAPAKAGKDDFPEGFAMLDEEESDLPF